MLRCRFQRAYLKHSHICRRANHSSIQPGVEPSILPQASTQHAIRFTSFIVMAPRSHASLMSGSMHAYYRTRDDETLEGTRRQPVAAERQHIIAAALGRRRVVGAGCYHEAAEQETYTQRTAKTRKSREGARQYVGAGRFANLARYRRKVRFACFDESAASPTGSKRSPHVTVSRVAPMVTRLGGDPPPQKKAAGTPCQGSGGSREATDNPRED